MYRGTGLLYFLTSSVLRSAYNIIYQSYCGEKAKKMIAVIELEEIYQEKTNQKQVNKAGFSVFQYW